MAGRKEERKNGGVDKGKKTADGAKRGSTTTARLEERKDKGKVKDERKTEGGKRGVDRHGGGWWGGPSGTHQFSLYLR